MLPGDQPDRFVTWGQAGKCISMDPEDIDIVGVRALSGATTTGASDYRLLLSMTGTWALTLGATYAGFRMTLANTGTGVITATPSSGTVAGRASILIYPGETFDVVSDGSNWRCPGRGRVVLLSQTVVSSATAQIDLTRGFTDDPEVTGMRIEYNGLSASAGASLLLSGLTPSAVGCNYVSVRAVTGSSTALATSGTATPAVIGSITTSIATSRRGILEAELSSNGSLFFAGDYFEPEATFAANNVSGYFSSALSGLRIGLNSAATISTARITQYGFRGA